MPGAHYLANGKSVAYDAVFKGRMTVRVAYSNLACPEWSIEEVAQAAVAYGYDGVELRLFEGSVIASDLPQEGRARIRKAFADARTTLIGIGASTRFTDAVPGTRQQQEDTLVRYVALAQDLGASFVRTFGGDWNETTKVECLSRVTDSLQRVAERVAGSGIQVLLETHDGFSHSAAVAAVLQKAGDTPALGAIWDVHHPYRMGEAATYTQAQLAPYLRHVHIKDAVRDGQDWKLVPLGTGEVPVREIVDRLRACDYAGWLTVEWERAWHMEIAPAHIALPYERQVLREWL